MPKPYIIREVANSHCGNFNKCLNLIEKFKYKDKTKLGTKFQIISPEYNNGLMTMAPGAFIILGLIIWLQRTFTKYVEE